MSEVTDWGTKTFLPEGKITSNLGQAASLWGLIPNDPAGEWGGLYNEIDRQKQTNVTENAAADAVKAEAQRKIAAEKAAAEEKKNKIAARMAMTTSGFSSGGNTARQFLTTF